MTNAAPRLYRLLRATAERAPKAHRGVIWMVIIFCSVTAIAVNRVSKRHDVMRVGYQLSKVSQHLAQLREANRRLTVELAMLTAPERIRTLATQLGMQPVPPDRIRLVVAGKADAVNASVEAPPTTVSVDAPDKPLALAASVLGPPAATAATETP